MNDQAKTLRNQIQRRHDPVKTIAFASGKGGVGKSNTALNFAIKLQHHNKSTLLFDLDVGMGNIDVLLGNRSKYSINHFFTDNTPLHGIIESGPKGLSYIAGGASLHELIVVSEDQLQRFLSAYSELAVAYDYVIFDLGAGVSATTMAFILAADECFIVTTPEPTAITDAYSVVKQIIQHNTLLPIHLLMNRVPNVRQGKMHVQRFERVVNHFLEKDLTSANILLDDKAVMSAVMAQCPYVLSQPKAAVSEMMAKIVNTYVAENPSQEGAQRHSFVAKLKRLLKARSE